MHPQLCVINNNGTVLASNVFALDFVSVVREEKDILEGDEIWFVRAFLSSNHVAGSTVNKPNTVKGLCILEFSIIENGFIQAFLKTENLIFLTKFAISS